MILGEEGTVGLKPRWISMSNIDSKRLKTVQKVCNFKSAMHYIHLGPYMRTYETRCTRSGRSAHELTSAEVEVQRLPRLDPLATLMLCPYHRNFAHSKRLDILNAMTRAQKPQILVVEEHPLARDTDRTHRIQHGPLVAVLEFSPNPLLLSRRGQESRG